ncbi:MAG: hypothetical protein Q9225_007741 [Loekoesia sp. 1 TL-2023]
MYSNPAVKKLSEASYNLVRNVEESPIGLVEKQARTMKGFRVKYKADLPESPKTRLHALPKDGDIVILTGSTGSLGSYIPKALLRQANVGKVYCLHGAENGMEKQSQVDKPRGLTIEWPADHVRFSKVDFSKPNFALNGERYTTFLQHTTDIIHCQRPVNLNLSITSFEPHIRGVRHFMDFWLGSNLSSSLFSISSVTIASHLNDGIDIPEAPIDVLTTTNGGYGTSKYICEFILQNAYEHSGLNAVICRLGQVVGPVLRPGGIWSKQEWLPIIASSNYLGLLPSTLGSMELIDWIPVDLLGNIVELAGAAELHHEPKNGFHKIDVEPNETVPVYHAVNPEYSMWADLVPRGSQEPWRMYFQDHYLG